MNKKSNGQFYFPLFRAIALLVGSDPRRSESNFTEALIVCLAMYLIHYLFFAARLIPPNISTTLAVLLLILLAFGVWIFWLLLVYFNSLVIRMVQLLGLFRDIPQRRLQSILWISCTTTMACLLLNDNQFLHEIAALWLVAVVMNLAAAAFLAWRNAARDSGE